MNKRERHLFVSLAIASSIALGVTTSVLIKNGGNIRMFSSGEVGENVKELSFTGANHPNISTGALVNYTEHYDYNGNIQAGGPMAIKYVNAKYNTVNPNYHIRVQAGGTVEKLDESYDLRTMTITYGGSDNKGIPLVRLYRSIDDANSDISQEINYVEKTPTSGVQFDVKGFNYWKIIISKGITNLSFSFTSGCRNKVESLGITAELNPGVIYYKDGFVPRGSDFTVKETLEVNGKTQEIIIPSSDVKVTYAEDFLTNGGEIKISYCDKEETINVPLYIPSEESNRYECEDSTIDKATGISQIVSNDTFSYTDPVKETDFVVKGTNMPSFVNENTLKMIAGAFLGYTDESGIKASGTGAIDEETTNYSGLVTYFNTDATMTTTINSDRAKYAILKARGATNSGTQKGTMYPLIVKDNVDIVVNGDTVSDYLISNDAIFTTPAAYSSSDPNNRNYNAGGISLDGRYRFINWTNVTLGVIKLSKGENTLQIKSKTNTGGNWDYFELVDLIPPEGVDDLYFEAEDADLHNCDSIKLLTNNSNWSSYENGVDYVDSCNYAELHAKSYLGYFGTQYECHGTNSYGGLVHMFNSKDKMTFTINVNSAGYYRFLICGSSNKSGNTSTHTVAESQVSNVVDVTLNDESIAIKSSLKLRGKTDTTIDTTVNRTGTYSGRYIYLLWTEIDLGYVKLHEGVNTVTITGKVQDSGNWDYIRFVR